MFRENTVAHRCIFWYFSWVRHNADALASPRQTAKNTPNWHYHAGPRHLWILLGIVYVVYTLQAFGRVCYLPLVPLFLPTSLFFCPAEKVLLEFWRWDHLWLTRWYLHSLPPHIPVNLLTFPLDHLNVSDFLHRLSVKNIWAFGAILKQVINPKTYKVKMIVL